jgi:predicted ATPase
MNHVSSAGILCGREEERKRIGQWLDRIVIGRGSVLSLLGEPGVGKTTLLRDAIRQSRDRDLLVFETWCRGTEWEPSWFPFAFLMEQAQTTFADHPQSEPFSDALQAWMKRPETGSWHHAMQLIRHLRLFARSRPFVFFLDDFHLASDSLVHLMRDWQSLDRRRKPVLDSRSSGRSRTSTSVDSI